MAGITMSIGFGVGNILILFQKIYILISKYLIGLATVVFLMVKVTMLNYHDIKT